VFGVLGGGLFIGVGFNLYLLIGCCLGELVWFVELCEECGCWCG
jgi:hypothetical protein